MSAPSNRNVFINCPFDEEYLSLLRPLLFTVVYLGFNPRIASESSNSGEIRLDKICELIQNSLYSIHDLSRLKSSAQDEYARQNMPFELGLDMGCMRFAKGRLTNKKMLILEIEPYRYMRALSDISGLDIKNHGNEPEKLVRQVRNWFVETIGLRNIPLGSVIWYRFLGFASDFYQSRFIEGYTTDEDLNMMPIPEYIDHIRDWCRVANAEPYAAASQMKETVPPHF